MINYGIIQHSIEHYEQVGFQRVESPWTVTNPISDITRPKWAGEFTIKEKEKVLVASGEQSFLAMYNKGFLPKGKFQTVTPCFRDEKFDALHTKYFIKNELIITDDTSLFQLRLMVNQAREFFRDYCLRLKKDDDFLIVANTIDDVLIVKTTSGKDIVVDEVDVNDTYKWPTYDLVYRGIELGSYGIRKCSFLTWIYGTGVAEPRLSQVIEMYGISH